jgi:hypothetical protein
MAPKSVTIRTYQVGFGDCFLLSFDYGPRTKKHVLIDFGSTGLPPGVPTTRMRDIARDIEKQTGGKLHAVVATHRHKDHISGFETNKAGTAPGDIIRRLKPDLVVQPWTEDPKLATKATGPTRSAAQKQLAALADMHEVARQALAATARMSSDAVPKSLKEQLSFLGEDNLKNLAAVKNLMTMSEKRSYVHYGSKSGLEKVLPGVKVHVLGPPTIDQHKEIKTQRSRDPDQFWHFQADAMRFSDSAPGGNAVLFPRHVRSRAPRFPIDARWLILRARAMHGDHLLQIVRILDDAMNNTSVILAFEVGGKRLLFPGDAQIENWEYALDQAKKSKKLKSLLSGVNLYKVGHHGSLNATPKDLWKMFDNKSPRKGPQRLESLMSTMEGKHGSEKRGTEVPRSKLVTELEHETNHFSTQELPDDQLFHPTVVTF